MNGWVHQSKAIVAGILFALAVQDVQAAALKPPFSLPTAAKPGPAAAECAKSVPAPLVSLDLASRYNANDPTHSQVVEDQETAYNDQIAPARIFLQDVARFANNSLVEGKGGEKAAACAINWLKGWADADALSDLKSRQSGLSMTRIISGLALSYMQVQRSAAGNAEDRKAIESWLFMLGQKAETLFPDGEAKSSDENNHRYWGGLAVASVGVATGHRDMLKWGEKSYHLGVCQIAPDGSLPLEIARASRARDYHLHALTPLVMIAALGQANGDRLFEDCGGAIHRLAKFSALSVSDPSTIEKLAGAQQVDLPRADGGGIRADRVAWAAVYLHYFPAAAEVAAIPGEKPLRSSNLGGNMSELFGD